MIVGDLRRPAGRFYDVGYGPHGAMMHYALHEGKRLLHHGTVYRDPMESPADRLRAARERAGYDTAKAAALAMGAVVATYIQHENGIRGFPAGVAARYAKFFRTSPEWLLYGKEVTVAVMRQIDKLPF